MEMWHWADTVINYAPVTCWYMKPGGYANRCPEPKLAAMPVAQSRRDILPLALHGEGVVEGESMEAEVDHGGVTTQSGHEKVGWSDGKQLWWTRAKPGDAARLVFGVAAAGRYAVALTLTHANDYGIADIGLNGQVLVKGHDAYAEKVEKHVVELGVVELKPGENVLTLKLIGANPKAKPDGYMMGIDKLELRKAAAGL